MNGKCLIDLYENGMRRTRARSTFFYLQNEHECLCALTNKVTHTPTDAHFQFPKQDFIILMVFVETNE